jgi:hypothetical protein
VDGEGRRGTEKEGCGEEEMTKRGKKKKKCERLFAFFSVMSEKNEISPKHWTTGHGGEGRCFIVSKQSKAHEIRHVKMYQCI